MLSDEERKAVNLLKSYENKLVYEISEKDKKAVKTILNLIEKQSKEIEELKNEVMEKELIIDGMKENRRIAVEEIQEQYFVSKEESEQKERKAYIKGTNDAHELCNKKWEDKIKAKIEEIENTGIDVAWEQVNYTIREQDRAKIEVLQSLLEKE